MYYEDFDSFGGFDADACEPDRFEDDAANWETEQVFQDQFAEQEFDADDDYREEPGDDLYDSSDEPEPFYAE
jgi:hypothetical protein